MAIDLSIKPGGLKGLLHEYEPLLRLHDNERLTAHGRDKKGNGVYISFRGRQQGCKIIAIEVEKGELIGHLSLSPALRDGKIITARSTRVDENNPSALLIITSREFVPPESGLPKRVIIKADYIPPESLEPQQSQSTTAKLVRREVFKLTK